MKTKRSLILATLLCAGALIPATANADDFHPGRHFTWVHRHFIWHNHHRVFWVPGHPGVR